CGRLLRNRLVREDANEDAAATLDVTRDRAASRFDLARGDAAALGGLQTEFAERHIVAARGDAGVAALLFLAELATCWLQHAYSPLPSPPGAAALRTRLTAAGPFGASAAPASAGLSLPSAGPRPSRYHSVRAISMPFRRPALMILMPWAPRRIAFCIARFIARRNMMRFSSCWVIESAISCASISGLRTSSMFTATGTPRRRV